MSQMAHRPQDNEAVGDRRRRHHHFLHVVLRDLLQVGVAEMTYTSPSSLAM